MEMTVEQAIKEIRSWYLPTTKQREAIAVINNALTENKKMKKEINKEIDIVKNISDECKQLRDFANKSETENDKLKDSINKMSRNKSNLIEENEKLKEEIEQLKVDKEIALGQMVNAINDFVELNNQISAVEVLEWLREWSSTIDGMSFACATVDDMLENFTPQEIVDKITEYENKKYESVSNCDEFNVGDWVIPYGRENDSEERYLIESIDGDLLKVKYQWGTRGWGHAEFYKSDVFVDTECIAYKFKHAEPPMEELQFKVGDYVKCTSSTNGKVFYGEITDCYEKCADVDLGNEKNGCFFYGEMEHAEPPKEHDGCYGCKYGDKKKYEQPCVNCNGTAKSLSDEYKSKPDLWEENDKLNIEWVYECAYVGCYGNYYVKAYFNTENEAINYCENNADKVFGYRKVCRKKDC